jgi:uncharacterized protein
MPAARGDETSPPLCLPPLQWNWRALCRVLHRDLGYLFFGTTIVYAVSGLAINHRHDWNPSYSVARRELTLQGAWTNQPFSRTDATHVLARADVGRRYQSHYLPQRGQARIFFEGGNATLDLATGAAVVETVSRRPLLHIFNKLHYNPGRGWTWFADAFGAALLVVAVTGLFLLRGRHGITRRGGALVGVGIVVPAAFVLFVL